MDKMETQQYFVFIIDFTCQMDILQKKFLAHSYKKYHGVVVNDIEAFAERVLCEIKEFGDGQPGCRPMGIAWGVNISQRVVNEIRLSITSQYFGSIPTALFYFSIIPVQDYIDFEPDNFLSTSSKP